MKAYQVIIGAFFVSIILVGGALYAVPTYKVWQAQQDGRAILARAESTKQAQILDAEAKMQAAVYLRKAGEEMSSILTPQYLELLRLQMLEQVGEHNPNVIYLDASPKTITVK